MSAMTFLLFLFLSVPVASLAQTPTPEPLVTYDEFIKSPRLEMKRADFVLGEKIVSMMKLNEKGYINQDILKKITAEVEGSKNFQPFKLWLRSLSEVSGLKATNELMAYCRRFIEPKETAPLERVLERKAGNYCRERALEAIGRDVKQAKSISPEATQFIQEHLKFFLTKKNKVNFAFFMQTLSDQPEVMKKLSQEVTMFSVRNEIVPSQEVLKDMLINEQITKLIQDKGFNPLQHQNVFYAEYSKLIELGYRSLENKPPVEKVKDQYTYLRNYLELNQDHLPMGLCLTRLNDFAKSITRAGFIDLSRDIFKYVIKKNNKEILEDAQFFYLWTYFVKDDFKGAYKLADDLKLLKKDAVLTDPRIKFWLAVAEQELGKKSEAVKRFEDIITGSPLSFYAIMSHKKLIPLAPESKSLNFYKDTTSKTLTPMVLKLNDLDDDFAASLVRLKVWAKIDSSKMIAREIKRIQSARPTILAKHAPEKHFSLKSDLHLINAKLIQESGIYLSTFRYLYQAMDKQEVVFNRTLLEVLYPQPYYKDLSAILKKSLDPLIVLSLIRQESVFNPIAQSPVGARGLMQLMPATARRMRRGVRDRNLVQPKLNLELGTQYFKGLHKRYEGNLVFVLAAYNAGEGRVTRWRELYFDPDASILKNIEVIPFLETRNYVKLIFRNIFFYKLLLEDKEPGTSSDLNKMFDVELGFKQ
jgi:soluble lytic murein transglycosylase